MLGTKYFLKIAKNFYSKREKPMCPRRKMSFHETEKKIPNPQK